MEKIYTYQDYLDETGSIGEKISKIIRMHRTGLAYKIAIDANAYDRQMNTTISNFVKKLYSADGREAVDFTAANNRITSNFFHRLNTQRNTYSLGNGLTFTNDSTKEKLGVTFDNVIREAGYDALIHGMSFLYWNFDRAYVFDYTEFAPLWDEETGALRAGVRFWQVDWDKPVIAIFYEEDGYTTFKGNRNASGFVETKGKHAYVETIRTSPNQAEPDIVGEENYGALPIIPLYGNDKHQSTLVGLKAKIDAYDLVSSGFANDLQDCAEIYWIISGAGGMSQTDLNRFRDRLKLFHTAAVADEEVSVTPYTQQIPTEARQTFLEHIHSQIYEDFGALDVHSVDAGSTNDHLEAAYQPMDENADAYEYQIIDTVQKLLQLIGIEDTPIFKRNRISNTKEQTETILLAANYLDDETILNKLPFLTPDEVEGILERKDAQDSSRLLQMGSQEKEQSDDTSEGEDIDAEE